METMRRFGPRLGFIGPRKHGFIFGPYQYGVDWVFLFKIILDFLFVLNQMSCKIWEFWYSPPKIAHYLENSLEFMSSYIRNASGVNQKSNCILPSSIPVGWLKPIFRILWGLKNKHRETMVKFTFYKCNE